MCVDFCFLEGRIRDKDNIKGCGWTLIQTWKSATWKDIPIKQRGGEQPSSFRSPLDQFGASEKGKTRCVPSPIGRTSKLGSIAKSVTEVVEKTHRTQVFLPKTAGTMHRALEQDCTGLGWTAKEEPGGQGAKQLLDLPAASWLSWDSWVWPAPAEEIRRSHGCHGAGSLPSYTSNRGKNRTFILIFI